ncbi:hypothetical protein MCOR27_003161 [Pyricularia oryzae]|nr:hypothetical protein MCOR27_003161 [Pyricularia oryzae]KAI6560902.1 hypothetical protein MCOR04_009603 [Pyricularia oryzae]
MPSSNQERQRQRQQQQQQAQQQAQEQQQNINSWPRPECCGHFADAYGNFAVPRSCENEDCNMRGQDRSAVQTATIRSSSGSSADANLCSQLTPTATDSQTMNKLKRLPPTWAGQMSQTREIAESPDAAGRDAASTGRDGVKNTAQNIRIDTICALLTYIRSPDVTKCDFSRRTNLFSQFSPDISH